MTTPSPVPTQISTPKMTTGKIKIHYEGNAMVELISPEGTRVLVDVYNPSGLSYPAKAEDILLTTHTHGDHINADFLITFPGKQLFVRVGEIQAAGVNIQGIAAAHNSADKPVAENGTDYIFLIEMAGLRIAHFGDIGQDALTEEQLAILGRVDIAVMQFENSYSAMDTINKKGFTMMEQVKPRLIIPTHIKEAAVKLLAQKWSVLYSEQQFITVDSAELGAATRVIFLGSKSKSWADLVGATKINW